jgi:hypothetical protein
MTSVKIHCGACGFSTTVRADKGKDREVQITLESECERVKKMRDDIATLTVMAAFTGFLNNPVYRSAAKHLPHVACPVPSGILKALEVELGFNVPKDASIRFLKD